MECAFSDVPHANNWYAFEIEESLRLRILLGGNADLIHRRPALSFRQFRKPAGVGRNWLLVFRLPVPGWLPSLRCELRKLFLLPPFRPFGRMRRSSGSSVSPGGFSLCYRSVSLPSTAAYGRVAARLLHSDR